jgi:GTP-binding protein
LTRGPATQTLAKVRRDLSKWGDQITVQLFSSLKKLGMDEAEEVVGKWMLPFSAPADQA